MTWRESPAATDAGRGRLDLLADVVVVGLGLILALYVRYIFRDFVSLDFTKFTSVWYQAVKDQGLAATATDVSNYTPPYMYLLYAVARLVPDLSPVVAVKLPSVAADFLCAAFMFLIVRVKYPRGRMPYMAFFAVLLAPTVVANGSAWGQADSIYTSMLLACVYCLMINRPYLAMAAVGMALSLKFQTMFLAPALFAFWTRRKIPFWAPLLVPAMYLAMMVPASLQGRPWADLVTVYGQQSTWYRELTLNAPNLYAWIPDSLYTPAMIAGFLLMTVLGSALAWLVYRSRAALDATLVLQVCMLSLLMTPFCLPKMHDRFFFPADVLAIAYAFFIPRQYYVPIIVGLVSLIAYNRFLLVLNILPLGVLALLNLLALAAVAGTTWRALRGLPAQGALQTVPN